MNKYTIWFDQLNQISFEVEARGEQSARKKAFKKYKEYLIDTIDYLYENGELIIEKEEA